MTTSDETSKMPIAVPELGNDILDDLILSGDPTFLKRLSIAQGLSDVVQKHGKAVPGEFTYGDPKNDAEFVNLGKRLLAVVGPARAHAMVMHERQVKEESFDVNDPVFIRIRQKADSRSTPRGEGKPAYQYGTDWLMYVIGSADGGKKLEKFAVMPFMKTARREAKPLSALTGQVVEIFAFMIEGKKHTWFVPRVRPLTEQPSYVPIDEKYHNQARLAFKTGGGSGADDEDDDDASEEAPPPPSNRRPR